MGREVCRGRHLSGSQRLPPRPGHSAPPDTALSAHPHVCGPPLGPVTSGVAGPWLASWQLLAVCFPAAAESQWDLVGHSVEVEGASYILKQ